MNNSSKLNIYFIICHGNNDKEMMKIIATYQLY